MKVTKGLPLRPPPVLCLILAISAEEFAKAFATARIEIIKNCGHLPQVERLDVLNPLVAQYLEA